MITFSLVALNLPLERIQVLTPYNLFEQLLFSFGMISITDSIMVFLKIVNNITKHQPAKTSFQLSTFPTLHPRINNIIPKRMGIQNITKLHSIFQK
jgi:hypothetical protein